MKALSLSQPYASLVVTGAKQNETRGWKPSDKTFNELRGQPVAIHAALKFPDEYRRLLKSNLYFQKALSEHFNLVLEEPLPLGAIIGTVEITGFVKTDLLLSEFATDRDLARQITKKDFTAEEMAFGDYSAGRWAWVLENPKCFKNPIPCKGALNLWQVPLVFEEMINGYLETWTREGCLI